MSLVKKTVLLLALTFAGLSVTSSVFAQDWPMTGGDYWDVSGIAISDGAGLKYEKWLADEWRKNNEFAKSKGWIKDYFVLSNVNARKGEADLYLVRVFESMPSGPEGEKRAMEFMEWRKKSSEQMAAESGNRAEFREVLSSSLLQHMKFRD